MGSKVDQFVKTYKTVAQIPTLLKAKLRPNGVVNSAWSQRNIEKGKSTVFQRDFFTRDLKNVAEIGPIDISSELICKVSPSEKYKAVVRDCDGKKYLEIWKNNSFLVRVVDLNAISDLNIHGAIYTDVEFFSFDWSYDEKKILYLAEKKTPNPEPFYKRKGKDNNDQKGNGDEQKPKGDEYKFTQDWGEQLVGKKVTVIAEYNLEHDKVEVLKGLPENVCVAQVRYSPDASYVLGVAYDLEPRKLGLIYCTNRKSTIFKLDFNENYVALPLEGRAVKNPIFSPDGKTILWLQRTSGGPHACCMSLVKTSTPLTEKSEVKTVVDIVDNAVNINNAVFYGLYCQGFIQRPWGSRNRLIVSTNQKYSVNSYVIDIDNGNITELSYADGSLVVLDIVDDIMLACQSNFLTPDKLVIGKLPDPGKEQNIGWNVLVENNAVEGLENCMYKNLDLTADGESVESFNAIYIGPKNGDEKSVPLVVWPHGGPHSAFGNKLFLEGNTFLSLGYAILLVNYRGSIGSGQKSVEFLPGKIGLSDVQDCIQATDTALNMFNWLNPNSLVLVGGSHGGFLVTHLSGQYPDKFKAVSARNPVIDVASMSVISDIPDWCYVEGGQEYTQTGQIDKNILIAMRNASPIVHAHKVKAPTLLLIGSKDLRVPPHQGTEHYLRLKANGVITRMNLYDDDHPLGKVPNEMDAIINTMLWFDQHLNI